MHTTTAAIVPCGLAAHLHAAYGLTITSITPVPKGEDADAYRATSRAGERYFVRVEQGRTEDHLEIALAASAVLQEARGLEAIVVSLPTRQGAFTSRFGSATVALFPFVDGTTANDRSFSKLDWQRVAEIMAALHGSEPRGGVRALPHESFANPFAPTVRHALKRAAGTDAWPSPLQ